MVELFERDEITINRHSSKGNQLKWRRGDVWYKADYAGYEGLSEYVISNLLGKSSMDKSEFVKYFLEKIKYKATTFNGVGSKDISDGKYMITLERLIQNTCGIGLNSMIGKIEDHKQRLITIVDKIKEYTGLDDFGIYLSKMLTIDSVFLNEDRHLHNIAVLVDEDNHYDYCPIFDNGASLLSDTTMDYPLSEDVYNLIDVPKSKTFCRDFEEQLDIAEELYGENLHFNFTKKDAREIIYSAEGYSDEIKRRVEDIIYYQMNRYKYLFK